MRAYHIMIFLMMFNLCISLVGALHIYPTYVSNDQTVTPGTKYDVSDTNGGNSALYRFGGVLLLGSIGGIMAASVLAYFTKLPAAVAIAYGLFVNYFWAFTVDAFTVLWSIAGGNSGMTTVITIFAIIVGIIFLAGMMQLLTGGWRAVE